LTVNSTNTKGKIPYVDATKLMVTVDGKRTAVDRVTVLSKTNPYKYGVYVSAKVSSKSAVSLAYSDASLGLSAKNNVSVPVDNGDEDTEDNTDNDNTEDNEDTTENTSTGTVDGSNVVSAKVLPVLANGDSVPKAQNVPLFKVELKNNKSEEVSISQIKFTKN
jgi:hypothetical protein